MAVSLVTADVAPEGTPAQEAWDAQAALDVGVLIASYLLTHPAPEDSELLQNLKVSAENLQGAGRRRLDYLGLHPLRVIGGDA